MYLSGHPCHLTNDHRSRNAESHVFEPIVGTCDCKILCLDPFANDGGDALDAGSCQRLGPQPSQSWLSRVGPMRTWTTHPPRSSGTVPRGCTWPRVALPPNPPPIDRPIPPRSRARWENDVGGVCARCRPNPVPRGVALFSKATCEPGRIDARRLNWLGYAHRGISRATWRWRRHSRGAASSFSLKPCHATPKQQREHGRHEVGTLLFNLSIPVAGVRMLSQPHHVHHPSKDIFLDLGVFEHFQGRRRQIGIGLGRNGDLGGVVSVQIGTQGSMTRPPKDGPHTRRQQHILKKSN